MDDYGDLDGIDEEDEEEEEEAPKKKNSKTKAWFHYLY